MTKLLNSVTLSAIFYISLFDSAKFGLLFFGFRSVSSLRKYPRKRKGRSAHDNDSIFKRRKITEETSINGDKSVTETDTNYNDNFPNPSIVETHISQKERVEKRLAVTPTSNKRGRER